jgi:predicted Zn-dependent peptidase
MFQRTTLPNGLRVLTAPMPHTRSVTVSIYVGAGSRYETDEMAGASHFLEHLLFKGTAKRPEPGEIASAIDGIGGSFNAATDREHTVYYCKVASPHFPLALDVLMDMMRHPTLDATELERERFVILEELAMVEDSPAQQADLLLDEIMWPDQPLGRDVGGTPASVTAITRAQVQDYTARQYVPNNVVVSIAGKIEHDEAVGRVEELADGWAPGEALRWYPAIDESRTHLEVHYKKTEQAHLCLAVRGIPANHPDRYALALLSAILGEGMSSRLFMEMRERKGLAYDVHSYVANLLDTGSFGIYVGVDPKKAAEALKVALGELGSLKTYMTDLELTKAKELSKGRLLLRMEDTRAVSGWIGGQELLLERVLTPDEVVEQVEAVTVEDLQRVANRLLVGEQLHLAVVGPSRSDKRFAPLLRL